MTATLSPAADRAVRTYLDDLERMLHTAPIGDRLDVLTDVREHIEAALADEASLQWVEELDERAVRGVLSRIGTPASIAADALAGGDGAESSEAAVPHAPLLTKPWLPWLIVGLMALSVIPFLGWLAAIAGVVLFWRSPLWGKTAKVLGTIAYLMPLLVVLVFLLPIGSAQAASEVSGIGAFVPSSYDGLWSVVVATPLWLVPVSVVLALVAGRGSGAKPS